MASQLNIFGSTAALASAFEANSGGDPRGRKAEFDLDEEAMARHLDATGRYRVLRQLAPREIVADARS